MQQRHLPPPAAPSAGGVFPKPAAGRPPRLLTECYDEAVRPQKRVHLDPMLPPLRSTTPAEKLLPSKISTAGPQPSPFDLRLPECSLRKLVRDLMSLEEWLPWSAVEAAWRAKRPTWRRSLRHLEQTKSYDGHIPTVAAAVHELYSALQADKSTGLFSRAGPWETRAMELSQGGDNHLCLVQLWVELRDAVRDWQQANGAAQWNGSTTHHVGGTHAPGQLGVAGGHIAYRAFAALEAACERGEARLVEVPLEEILCHSTVHLAALRGIVERERQFVAACISELAAEALRPKQTPADTTGDTASGSGRDAAGSGAAGGGNAAPASGGEGGATAGGTASEGRTVASGGATGGTGRAAEGGAAAAGGTDTVGGAGRSTSLVEQLARSGSSILSPGLRTELQLMRAVESEVDTDLDFGSDGSDAE